jgi:hypothetical protein
MWIGGAVDMVAQLTRIAAFGGGASGRRMRPAIATTIGNPTVNFHG